MTLFIIFSSVLITYFLYAILFKSKSQSKSDYNNEYKQVPFVKENYYPIFGHGLSFSKDIISFMTDTQQKYGNIFSMKVFNKKMTIICGHEFKKEFFKLKEHEMSLTDVLSDLYFGNAFSDDSTKFSQMLSLIKKTITVRFDEFAPKIYDETQKMIKRMKTMENNKTYLEKEMIKFVSATSARCFVNLEINEQFYDNLSKFTNLLNQIVVLTYFIPNIILRYTIGMVLNKYRKNMTDILSHHIQKYRDDKSLSDSLFLRSAIDFIDEESGEKLSNQDIGDIIVCLLYVSSENTALGLSASLTELAMNEKWWNITKEESEKYINNTNLSKEDFNQNIKNLFKSELMDSVVMEAARRNTHIFALNRKPTQKQTIGDYYIGDSDVLVICEPLMMHYLNAKETFSNSEVYDPSRFMDERKEKKTSDYVMTWGSGIHICPGKMFAIYEIKMAIALITTTFKKFNISNEDYSNINYFSPSAFAERKIPINLQPIY